MIWVAISGSRKVDQQVEHDVREATRGVFDRGGGIVVGGALGVDYIATDEILRLDPTASRIKIYLPVTLELYASHYRRRADEGAISDQEAETLIFQLERVKHLNSSALIENLHNTVVNEKTYFERNTVVLEASTELLAFHVNESPGTKDTLEKAERRRMPVKKFTYTIQ